MTRNIEPRLQKLESQVPRQPTEHEKLVEYHNTFLMCAIACHLGDATPEDSVMEPYIRALGYKSSYEFLKACDANDPDGIERDRLARIKLLAKFGVSWDHEWDEIVDAYKRMEAGFSEHYKRTLEELYRKV
jgi:hypothetical protein